METFATENKNITETGVIKTTQGILSGMYVNSTNAGTISFIDGYETGAAAVGTLTSTGAMTPASHGQTELTSSGAMVAGTHAVTVFTGTGNFQEGVKASGYITCDGTQPTAGKVVVLGDITYTFVAFGAASTNTSTACDVPLGASATGTMNNLYNSMLYNPKVDVVKTSALVITATAKSVGTAGNSIAATEDDSHLDWDGSNTTLTGGVAADTITIGTTVYTAKAVPSAAYDFAIGSTLALSLANLVNAIQGDNCYAGTVAHTQVVVAASDATTITLRGRVPGTSLNAVATTETCANASFPDTTLGGGTGASDAGVTTAGATVTIGSQVYTVVDELSETYGAAAIAYQVKKGVAEANMLDNLKLAVNGTASGVGTLYSTGTVAHPYLIATTNTDTVQTFVSRTVGNAAATAVINGLATTETMTNTAFADSTFGGGTGNSNPAVTSDDALMTIDTVTYTFVDALSETSGAAAVANQILHGAAAANALDNMKLAINATGVVGTNYSTGTIAHPTVIATTNAADSQVVQAKLVGTGGNSIVTTDTLGNFAWGAATLASGTGKTGKVITGTITPAIGYHNLGNTNFNTGLYATIGGTALNVTLFYK
jgi:hypothetical protein